MAVFPNNDITRRIAACVDELQNEERERCFASLEKMYLGKPHIGLQLDMWTNPDTRTSMGSVTATTVCEPAGVWRNPNIPAQLYVRSEIIDFAEFPTTKTGDNIKTWFVKVLESGAIKPASVCGITPDGAADEQCGLSKIPTLAEKVDTCHLHQLQRAVLYSTGLAGAHSMNAEFKRVLKQHNRVVQLTRQSGQVAKAVSESQGAAGVPEHKILATRRTATTRWGNQYLQVAQNNQLYPVLQLVVDDYKKTNKNEKEAIVEDDESEQGSRVGAAVAAADIGLSCSDWDLSKQIEFFLEPLYLAKEAIEHTGYITGAQSQMMMHNITTENRHGATLVIKHFPKTPSLPDRARRERPCSVKTSTS
jgi:hypothetical protein